jgi:hypothetical protein
MCEPPATVRGVMGIEERAREPRVGGRMAEDGVEEAALLLPLGVGVEDKRERNWELFILML